MGQLAGKSNGHSKACPDFLKAVKYRLEKGASLDLKDFNQSLAKKINIGLNNLDFTGKQQLLRLLVEKVFYNERSIEILTVIPLGEQLHPICRGGWGVSK